METLGDRLDQMRVRATTPGGSISADLYGRNDVRVSFAPGYYQRVDKNDLEEHLASLARLLWVARMREYYAMLSEGFGYQITGGSRAISPIDVEYERQRESVLAEGRSADDAVHISVRGMKTWTVRTTDHAVSTLPEEEFAARIGEAAKALIRDHRQQIMDLKYQIYKPALA